MEIDKQVHLMKWWLIFVSCNISILHMLLSKLAVTIMMLGLHLQGSQEVMEEDDLRKWRALRKEQDEAYEDSLRIDQQKVQKDLIIIGLVSYCVWCRREKR